MRLLCVNRVLCTAWGIFSSGVVSSVHTSSMDLRLPPQRQKERRWEEVILWFRSSHTCFQCFQQNWNTSNTQNSLVPCWSLVEPWIWGIENEGVQSAIENGICKSDGISVALGKLIKPPKPQHCVEIYFYNNHKSEDFVFLKAVWRSIWYVQWPFLLLC